MSKSKVIDKDLGYKRILEEIKKSKNSYTTVGVHENEPDYEDGISVPEVAAINEFGAGNVKERSFLRSTFDTKKNRFLALTRKLFGKIVDGKDTVERALYEIGFKQQEEVRTKIETIKSPANAPSTVAGKPTIGNNPLINSRKLLASINHEETIK